MYNNNATEWMVNGAADRRELSELRQTKRRQYINNWQNIQQKLINNNQSSSN